MTLAQLLRIEQHLLMQCYPVPTDLVKAVRAEINQRNRP
jgi:hypothetical protein